MRTRPVFPPVKICPLPDNQQKKPAILKQFLIFFERNVRTKLTNRQYLVIALLQAPILAVIAALLSRYAENEHYTLWGNKNFISYIFMSVIVVTFIGMIISAEEIIKDRPILKRERFLRLSRGSYLSSKMVYLFALSGLQTFLFILIGNTILKVGLDMFAIWWSILWITAFLANLTGLWLSQTLNSIVSIYITIPLLIIPQILLCGLVVPFEDLNMRSTKKNLVPLIGEVIPSRWAFEALVVEQFRSNAFNEPFFLIEREKYLAQYYGNILLPEIRSISARVEAGEADPGYAGLLEKELDRLASAARIPARQNEPVSGYLDQAQEALRTRANNFTALLEKRQQELINLTGTETYNQLKMANHNRAIEDLVTGINQPRFFLKVNDRLYPKVGQIYVKPENNWGRAQFYSSEKRVANHYVPTYFFNLLVLGCFVLLTIIAIFAEFPGRFAKQRNIF